MSTKAVSGSASEPEGTGGSAAAEGAGALAQPSSARTAGAVHGARTGPCGGSTTGLALRRNTPSPLNHRLGLVNLVVVWMSLHREPVHATKVLPTSMMGTQLATQLIQG